MSLQEQSEPAIWFSPGIHGALAVATIDVVDALRSLSSAINEGLAETQSMAGEEQGHSFSYYISEKTNLALIRIALFHLLSAISCEELINLFSYFELPKDASETLEKLQPTEKLILAASFLGQPDVKSTHVYEGLKALTNWRNQFAHGHNPGRSTKSLHKNHAAFPEPGELSTFEDELRSLKKAAMSYQNVTGWLSSSGTRLITKADFYSKDAAKFVQFFDCFSSSKRQFPADPNGVRYEYYDLLVDEDRLRALM